MIRVGESSSVINQYSLGYATQDTVDYITFQPPRRLALPQRCQGIGCVDIEKLDSKRPTRNKSHPQ